MACGFSPDWASQTTGIGSSCDLFVWSLWNLFSILWGSLGRSSILFKAECRSAPLNHIQSKRELLLLRGSFSEINDHGLRIQDLLKYNNFLNVGLKILIFLCSEKNTIGKSLFQGLFELSFLNRLQIEKCQTESATPKHYFTILFIFFSFVYADGVLE